MIIKVCGMKQPENIRGLLQLPIDLMGLIFYKKSKRYAGSDEVRQWLEQHEALFENVGKVGVFVNAEVDEILNHIHDYQLDYIQLHGEESPEYCAEIRSFWEISSMRKSKIIKAFSVDKSFDFAATNAFEGKCELFLFDTKGADYGGNGVTFDWSLLQKYKGHTPFILSGGIELAMASAIKALPYPQLIGVDINSRFEESPGLKDLEKISDFVQTLKEET